MIKTMQHKKADEVAKSSFSSCFKELSKLPLNIGFFKGTFPRTIWLTSAIAVAGSAAESLESVYRQTKSWRSP